MVTKVNERIGQKVNFLSQHNIYACGVNKPAFI